MNVVINARILPLQFFKQRQLCSPVREETYEESKWEKFQLFCGGTSEN